MNVVPDASVVVKWFVPERDHGHARDLRDDYLDGQHEFLAPALLPFEVMNALKYSRLYDDDQLRIAAQSVVEYDIKLRSFARSGAVIDIAQSLDVSLYDASYVSIATAADGRMYTADDSLLSAISDTEYIDRLAHIHEYG